MSHRRLPPLNWLRAFESAARTLSFTAAAHELNITQAAVSKQVRSLELTLQQPLFVRHARSLALTKVAESYLPKVQDSLDRLAIGTREVFGQPQTTAITVRCAVSFSVNWLAPRIPSYLKRHPERSVRILSSVWSDTFDPENFDLDIQYGIGRWPGYQSHRLTTETITPVCSPSAARLLKAPDDLRDCRLLHVMGYQEGWGIWLKAAGASTVDPGQGLHVDTSLAAFAISASGGGVALGRSSLTDHEIKTGRLVRPFACEVAIDEGFFLLVPENQQLKTWTEDFVTWLLAEAAGTKPL
jgi:LysR family transcriptional regulator, glycine cleavage system transcriptional activator